MKVSTAFSLLHEDVRQWVWRQRWHALRDIQECAIGPILQADRDVLISAATAAGKTEAAFLPACSHLAEFRPHGVGILSVSPLKALINDQYRRLRELCEILRVPLTPWHGDTPYSAKQRQRDEPGGVLLITPESLESLLLHRSEWCERAFGATSHVIIDEFHVFPGTERGCQLQSLLHRLEFLIGRTLPRVALSATMGDVRRMAEYLRPTPGSYPCEIIVSDSSHSDVKVQLRGYRIPPEVLRSRTGVDQRMADDLYRILRGSSHLIFANSRGCAESLAAALTDRCERNTVPNEFFPHHGSLSRDLRERLEARLQEEVLPTSAVCTMTLELGIDIGCVHSIAQIGTPHSVASLRQRLGRSGRRGEASILRLFISEYTLKEESHISDRLRMETVQSIALLELLLQGRSEPPPPRQFHLSTLVQQTMSLIAQYGAVRATQLWSLLCGSGPFSLVTREMYASILRGLGERDLIIQTREGALVLGCEGERLIGRAHFYAAFNTPDDYRLECDSRVIGRIPVDRPLVEGQQIVFGGMRWEVLCIDQDKRVVYLRRSLTGLPPAFGGQGPMVHDMVRRAMREVYLRRNVPAYLDGSARVLLQEGMECFHALNLGRVSYLRIGSTVHLLPWRGDAVTGTITRLLCRAGLAANHFGGVIDIRRCTIEQLHAAVAALLDSAPPDEEELAADVANTIVEKHDALLPDALRLRAYGRRYFDVPAAMEWLRDTLFVGQL